MLSDRSKRVLQAIIEEYINTAEPVSSSTIVENYGLEYSTATIRNDMAELEQMGYLEKPHTSAGRVPSAKGYRFYVDELLNEDKISLDEMQYIKSSLETRVNEIEDLTKIATNTLSEITHYTTVSIGPDPSRHIIEDVKFVLMGTRLVMAAILTDSGAIKETIIKFDEDISNEQIENLNYIFNNKLRGKPLEKIDQPMEEYIISAMRKQAKVIKLVINQMNKVIEENDEFYLKGANNVFNFPEFRKIDAARNFLSILDTKERVMELLNSGFANDINVYIGEENNDEELKDYSIVTFKHTMRRHGSRNYWHNPDLRGWIIRR